MEIINVEKTSNENFEITKVTFVTKRKNEIDYEIHFDSKKQSGDIIRNGIDYAGLLFEKNRLIDYDMVYSLSKLAITAIRKAGLTVPKEFC